MGEMEVLEGKQLHKEIFKITKISALMVTCLILVSLICYGHGLEFDNLNRDINFLYGCIIGLLSGFYISFLSNTFATFTKNGHLMES